MLTRGRGWPILLSLSPSIHFLSRTWRKLRRKNNVTELQGSQYFMIRVWTSQVVKTGNNTVSDTYCECSRVQPPRDTVTSPTAPL